MVIALSCEATGGSSSCCCTARLLSWGPILRSRAMVGLPRVVVPPGAEACLGMRQALIVLRKAAQIQGVVSGNASDVVVGEPRRVEGHEGVLQHVLEPEEARGFREATLALVLNGVQPSPSRR